MCRTSTLPDLLAEKLSESFDEKLTLGLPHSENCFSVLNLHTCMHIPATRSIVDASYKYISFLHSNIFLLSITHTYNLHFLSALAPLILRDTHRVSSPK